MTGFDLIIVGVGGQGAILASDIVGKAAVHAGLPVMSAETHGMAQRGGSVENHVRLDCRYGSLIPRGRADAVLALEPAETLRAVDYLSPDGVAVVNTNPVLPITVLSGSADYPAVDDMMKELGGRCKRLVAVDADALATQAGHPLTANVVMIGAVSGFLPLDVHSLEDSIRSLVPPKTVDVNLAAFRLGRKAAETTD
ncbi:MAG: indolepyruvate oxidoreductase subunit beta [ANME-2 cluster archaeon]|nr:indolepyruvate oxidoreductase subunit beta [ANME-2 cluster archaeon]